MPAESPRIPPQNVPPLDDRAGDASDDKPDEKKRLPPLLSRPWWLFLNSVASTLAAASAGVSALADTVFGRANLKNVNRLTKVSAAGTITESSLTDNGARVSGTEPLQLDAGAIPAEAQYRAFANALGCLMGLCYSADNQIVGFDCDWTGSQLLARHAVAVFLHKAGGLLQIKGSAGNVLGAPVTQTVLFTINPATGNLNNATGAYQVAGLQVVSARGAALTATGAATGAAPAAYNQAYIQTLATLVNNQKTRLDELESRLASSVGHGLIT